MEKKLEKLSKKITMWTGSPWSIIVHTFFFIGIFGLRFFNVSTSDILLILTTLVSLEAIYLAIFIQMTVNEHSENLEEVSEDIEELQENVEDISEDVEEIQKDVDEIQEDVEDISEDVEEISEEEDEKEEQKEKEKFNEIERTLKLLIQEISELKDQHPQRNKNSKNS